MRQSEKPLPKLDLTWTLTRFCGPSTPRKSVRAPNRAVALRAGLVRALASLLDDRRLTKAQHRVLRRTLVEQLDHVLTHLERLSSRDALEEIRGAIREYRDSERRQTLAGWRRRQ